MKKGNVCKCFLRKCAYHIPKIQKSVFLKRAIDLLYFGDVYDVILWKNKFGRSTAHLRRTNTFVQFHDFKEITMDTDED